MWLMQALGFLLSALPVEDILRNLHSLITPYIQQLEKLADETVRTQNQRETQSGHSWTLANRNRPLCLRGVTAVEHISAGPDWI